MNKLKLHHKGLYHMLCLAVSIATAVIAWCAVSSMPDIGSVIVSPAQVWGALVTNLSSGTLWIHIRDSLFRVIGGFLLGFFLSIPVAFLL